jgi:hypothetical protein
VKRPVRAACLVPLIAIALAGCVSPPAPKYQAAIANTELLIKHSTKLSVGDFTAAPGVSNRSLGMRGSQLNGGSDGTFSTYLHDALTTELQTAAHYDPSSDLRISGVLTRNELDTGVKTGTAAVGGEFSLTRGSTVCFKKTLVAQHHWESSIIGAVAIPTAIDNYSTTVQKLLGELFSDSDFIAAL